MFKSHCLLYTELYYKFIIYYIHCRNVMCGDRISHHLKYRAPRRFSLVISALNAKQKCEESACACVGTLRSFVGDITLNWRAFNPIEDIEQIRLFVYTQCMRKKWRNTDSKCDDCKLRQRLALFCFSIFTYSFWVAIWKKPRSTKVFLRNVDIAFWELDKRYMSL